MGAGWFERIQDVYPGHAGRASGRDEPAGGPSLCRLQVKGEKTITSRTSYGPRGQGFSSSTSARALAASYRFATSCQFTTAHMASMKSTFWFLYWR